MNSNSINISPKKNIDDSLNKRYIYKLVSGIVGFVISLVTQAIVPRTLGPVAYGSFTYQTNFFQRFLGIFDLWITPYHFIRLSQRPKEFSLLTFTLFFTSIISIILIIVLALTHSSSTFYEKILPDQYFVYILLAAIWAILRWYWEISIKVADATCLTVQTEKWRIVGKIVGLVLLLILYFYHKLNLNSYFLYTFFVFLILSGVIIWVIIKNGIYSNASWKIPIIKLKEYIRDFYEYSHSLFFIGSLAIIAVLFDRWLLQIYGGSVEQGYYGLSFQIGLVSTLFIGAMVPLITREFSISFDKKDIKHMAFLFRRYIPLLYSISAYFSCFIAVESEKFIYIFGGKEFKEALIPVIIMSFYPIHQTYGQLSSAVFMASGKTKLYSKISLLFLTTGALTSFFLLAPKNRMGLDAGATGLAIKMVVFQILSVNVQLYFNSKMLKLNFFKYLIHQLANIICLIGIASISKFIIDIGFNLHEKVIISFFLSGIIYSIITFTALYFIPNIFGIKQEDILKIKKRITNMFH